MKFRIALALIAMAAFSRLLPHPHNFTAIGAMALFGAAYFDKKWMALTITFASLFLSDLLLNNLVYSAFYDGFVWFTSELTYLAFGLVMLLGRVMLYNKVRPLGVVMASLGASTVFFLVSNFGSWMQIPLYSKDWSGLMSCYIAGLPFFGNTIMGDLFFSAVLFGLYEWSTRRFSQSVPA